MVCLAGMIFSIFKSSSLTVLDKIKTLLRSKGDLVEKKKKKQQKVALTTELPKFPNKTFFCCLTEKKNI